MAKVEIYSSALCGFCRAAKQVLSSKGIEFEEYSIDMAPPVREEMTQTRRTVEPACRRSSSTTPTWAAFDDMMELEADDELDGLLGND